MPQVDLSVKLISINLMISVNFRKRKEFGVQRDKTEKQSKAKVEREKFLRENKAKVPLHPTVREFFWDNLLVLIHFFIKMILVNLPCATGV